MTKIVLKKSEVLKSARPLVIQPLDYRTDSSNGDNSSKSPYNKQSTEEFLKSLDNHEENSYNNTDSEQISNEEMANLEKSSQTLLQNAQSEADNILNEAHKNVETLLSEAQNQKKDLLSQANSEAEDIRSHIEKESSDAKQQAIDEGMKEGYQKSEEESKRLIALLQTISVQMVDEKKNILDTIEADIVELILMISSKVVKSITTQYKQVVYDNVVAAIEKLKIHNNLVIKVNPDDLYTMEQYKANLLKEINGIENIQFLEDPTLEPGGCIVKSDFGSIDGRISSQLAEIEEQIRKISPIKPL